MTVERLVESVTEAWASDEATDVVWAGYHEGRRGVRMRQTVRDFTTVWFDIGERTMTVEAYVLPSPPRNHEEVYRQCLVRNAGTRRMAFALDRDGDVVLRARVPIEEVDEADLEMILGEVYELVEVSFRPMARAAFAREKKA